MNIVTSSEDEYERENGTIVIRKYYNLFVEGTWDFDEDGLPCVIDE